MSLAPHCPWHGTLLTKPCPECEEELAGQLPETVEGRVEELRRLMEGILTVSFPTLHERIERLMGRPVWVHEFAYPDLLLHELENGEQVTFEDVVKKIPEDKTIILIGDEQ